MGGESGEDLKLKPSTRLGSKMMRYLSFHFKQFIKKKKNSTFGCESQQNLFCSFLDVFSYRVM